MHKLVKVLHTPILQSYLLPCNLLKFPPVANKGAMQMAEVVEYLKPPDAACDASQLGLRN